MLIAAAACPASPLLARPLTGTDPVVPDLRQACAATVAALAAAAPDLVVVVGEAGEARSWDPAGLFDAAAFAPALGATAAPGMQAPARAVRLPASLGLGNMLLDQASYAGRRELHSVTQDDTSGDCAALGARLAALADRVALLVMADGSATRTLKAPGYLDERSTPFDAEIARAIADGDLDALLTMDAGLARQLMATGRPAWQVLAGAAGGRPVVTEIHYRDAPFGVFYLVAGLAVVAAP
jgi:hypothetical protein